jgi:RNA recognition motif-containing protein
MQNNLYVSSLAWATTDESLKAYFQTVGTVTSASVIKDKMSGRSRGFGFVEMSSEAEANAAVEKLNNTDLDGRTIRVAIAQPREDRPRREFNNAQAA